MEWISLEEQTPPKGEPLIVSRYNWLTARDEVICQVYCIDWESRNWESCNRERGRCNFYIFNYGTNDGTTKIIEIEKVKAWQRMPKPYEEEK